MSFLGDALDVFHKCHGIGENAFVDSLENVAHARACLAECRDEGVIDVAAAIGATFQKGSMNSESIDDICYRG